MSDKPKPSALPPLPVFEQAVQSPAPSAFAQYAVSIGGGGVGGNGGRGTAVVGLMQSTVAQSELNRLVQQLYELRNVLKPFAEFAEALPRIVEGQPRLTDSGPAFTTSPFGKNHVISFADLRRAKELVDRLDEEDNRRFLSKIERQMGGNGDFCLTCGKAITGSETYELRGFCSPEHDPMIMGVPEGVTPKY